MNTLEHTLFAQSSWNLVKRLVLYISQMSSQMVPIGQVFLMWLERNLVIEHYRSHIFCLIIVKLSQYIGFIDFLDKLENGSDRWNTLFSSPDCSGEVLELVFVRCPSVHIWFVNTLAFTFLKHSLSKLLKDLSQVWWWAKSHN